MIKTTRLPHTYHKNAKHESYNKFSSAMKSSFEIKRFCNNIAGK